MVARPATPVRSANAGEFAPSARGRVDIKQYYSAALASKNIEPVPQGGFRRMGGSWRIGKWRKPLVPLAITSPTPTFGPHTGTQTIWTGTVAGPVAAVLCSSLAINAGSATFIVEALVAGVWTLVAGPFAVSNGSAVTRLAAFEPGGQKAATSLRVRATFSTSATVSGLVVTAFSESGTALRPRFVQLMTDAGAALSCFVTAGIADFFTEDGHKGAARLATVTEAMLPDLGFYAEGNTVGIFHGQLATARLFLATSTQLHDWRSDLWPYDPVPKADLGGTYPKTDDVWELAMRWSADSYVYVSLTVNGETTSSVPLANAGTPCLISVAQGTPSIWNDLATALQAALVGLPSLGAGVTVTTSATPDTFRKFLVTFGGTYSGSEYEVSALIANTANVSILPYHIHIGETELEDLFSVARGWPGTVELVQDRMGYARIPAVTGSLALSRVGEYFDLNAEATTDNAPRLDKLRSQTSEAIVHVKESGYIFAFTDRGVYFVPNRTIERNTPLNFVKSSDVGAQPNCLPFDLEGGVHYVAIAEKGLKDYAAGGNQLLRLDESAVTSSTSFEANPVSLLSSHLVFGVVRSARQKALSDLDASKGWLMRADGRLVAGQFIRNQDITGFCEWIAAASGLVREIGIDGQNSLWLAVDRNGEGTIELYDPTCLLQDAVEAVPDLAGAVTGLEFENGAELWAVADGYVLGPYTCQNGAIDLQEPHASALVGRWQAPRWESMAQVYVTPSDDVVWRPGRIHTLAVNIIDTTSIAVGANGGDPVDVVLNEVDDPVNQAMPAKTKLITVNGADLTGYMTGTTAVITQKRPGELYVRDLAIGAKL